MTWTTKLKDLSTTAMVGYTSTDGNIIGRTPIRSTIKFSSLELFGAAARCSHLNLIDPTIATPEYDMIAKLIERHVDDLNPDFAILSSADSFKDYVKSYFAGTVATGLAYLSMINEGYVWADHFENVGGGDPTCARKPDFVFADESLGVSLMESKGSRSGSLSSFDNTVADGYTGQVEPHLGHLVGGVMATHGYCIGSWLKSTTQAELRIHYTRSPPQQNVLGADDIPSLATIQRHNFSNAFTLAHSPQLGLDLRKGQSRDPEILFLRTEWLGRRWLTGHEVSTIFWRALSIGQIPDRLKYRRRSWGWSSATLFAVEEQIAKTVLASFLDQGDEVPTDLPDIQPLDEDTLGAARAYRADGGGGAVFPDGLAILDLRLLRLEFDIVTWSTKSATFVET